MRATACAASVLLLANFAFAQPSSLNTLEQGLQSPAAPGGAAPAAGGGYLGAELDDVGENGQGVRVKAVRPGTPAEASGLKANDLIVSIDGRKVSNLDDYDAVAKRPAGAKMVYTVDRGGRQQSLAVMLGTRGTTPSVGVTDQGAPELQSAAPALTAPGGGQPSTSSPGGGQPSIQPAPSSFGAGSPSSSSAPSLTPPGSASSTLPPLTLPSEPSPRAGGITAQPLDSRPQGSESLPIPGASGSHGAPAAGGTSASGGASLGITVGSGDAQPSRARRRGAYIANVKPGSPAALAGLPIGGVIVQYDGRQIASDDDLVNAIRAARPGQEVELTYYDSADRLGKKMVRLAEAGASSGPASGAAGSGISGGFSSGGFGGATAQNPGAIPGTSEAPPRSPIGGTGRPLLNRVENAIRGAGILPAAGPTGPTTVYDPVAMATLQRQVADLIGAVNSLEERLRALEGKAGVTSPQSGGSPSNAGTPFGSLPPVSGNSPSPSFGSPQSPGFSSPSPSLTPGFAAPNP